MNRTLITSGTLAGLILAGGIVGTVSAQSTADATGLSLEQAMEIALTEVPGEVQEAELEREDGMAYFEVEILTAEGAETEVEINAETGEIIEISVESDDADDDDDDDDDREDCDKDA